MFKFYKNPINVVIQKIVDFNNNPIVFLQNIRKIIHKINKLRSMYYSLKFRRQLRRWLWVCVKEKQIMKKYSPANLVKLLENVDLDMDSEEEDKLDEVLNNW